MELTKGLLALIAAIGLEIAGPGLIRDLIGRLIIKLSVSPEHGALPAVLHMINLRSMHIAVTVVLLYALIRFIEAWGLWHMRRWASWLGCIGTAVYLPIDAYALYRHPGWEAITVLSINCLITGYLMHDIVRRKA